MQEFTVGDMVNSVSGAQSVPCACVCLCVLYIFVHVFVCEIECKLVVSCRPQCRLMPYRQVIYDLSVAGGEKGDTRLSLLINKHCSGAHIQSPQHVCERTDLALVFLFLFLSSQTSLSFLLIFPSYFLQFFAHIPSSS